MPMGGASEVPPQEDFGGAPNDGQNIGAGPGMEDPSAGGEPQMGDEAPMDGMADGNGQLDPGMEGGEPPMDGDGAPAEGDAGDDSTMSLFNQLSDEDKEAARGYIESMLQRDEEHGEEEMPDAEPEGGEPQPPMMETVIFKKSQLEKIHENLISTELEKDTDKVEKKKGKTNNNSPFNSPIFN